MDFSGEQPDDSGASHPSVACRLPTVPVSALGADGTVIGTTPTDGGVVGPVPTALMAATVTK